MIKYLLPFLLLFGCSTPKVEHRIHVVEKKYPRPTLNLTQKWTGVYAQGPGGVFGIFYFPAEERLEAEREMFEHLYNIHSLPCWEGEMPKWLIAAKTAMDRAKEDYMELNKSH